MNTVDLQNIIEAALLAAGRPLTVDDLVAMFSGTEIEPARQDVREALEALGGACEGRGIELMRVASGYRLQVRSQYSSWIGKLWAERPPRYSRALLETLALIAYRQPITRAEIEDVRGVGVSSSIVKTLLERDWVRVLGHRDVPGRPALYGTTRAFLDSFNLKSLDELPSLAELADLDALEAKLTAGAAADESISALPDAAEGQAAGSEPNRDRPEGDVPANELRTEDASSYTHAELPAE